MSQTSCSLLTSSSSSVLTCLALPLLLLLLLVNYGAGEHQPWCEPELCEGAGKHVACRNTGAFARRCPADSSLVDISRHKAQFVHEHNRRRNFIALGLLPGYYPASRMATMIWDEELEYLSSLNVRTCILDHDPCHNTFRFKNSGQNLCGVSRFRSSNVNVTSIIEEVMSLWWNEYPLIDSSYIDAFRVTKYFEDYGHFVGMVVGRNTHIGCAIAQLERTDYPYVYVYNVVCNYASVYALGAPVYDIGYTAYRCFTGKNPFYPGLCSTREKFDPNY